MATAIGSHLFSSTVTLLRTVETIIDGMQTNSWEPVQKNVRCRLDVTFVPVSKMQPMVIEAGRAPDRIGTAWFNPSMAGIIRPGDRIQVTGGPVPGTFSIDQIPDHVGGYSSLDHIEISILEVAQALVQTSES